jgi:hypothetical protein
MSRTKPPADDRPRDFAELVRTAPKHEKVIPKTRLAGWLYKTAQEGGFILQANDGSIRAAGDAPWEVVLLFGA